jgi:tetratricopeptide (TPR) repeat protein
LVVVFALSLGFRSQISEFLTFGPDIPPAPEISAEIPVEVEKSEALVTTSKPTKSAVSSYIGRDPGEIRPVPEEVKVFTEEQKKRIYETLQSHALAVKGDPNYFNGWIQIGLLKKTIGDFEGARDAWEYAGVIQPGNSLSFANLGELYWRYLHLYSKSEENLKISIKHKPDDTQTYVTLAELYHYSMKEKYDLADDVLLDGLKANPNNGTLMRRLAYLYEQRKEYTLALEWWEKVLADNPEDQEVANTINKLKAKIEKS